MQDGLLFHSLTSPQPLALGSQLPLPDPQNSHRLHFPQGPHRGEDAKQHPSRQVGSSARSSGPQSSSVPPHPHPRQYTRRLALVYLRASLPVLSILPDSTQDSPVNPSRRVGRRQPKACPGVATMAGGSQRPWSVPDANLLMWFYKNPGATAWSPDSLGRPCTSHTPTHPQPGAAV